MAMSLAALLGTPAKAAVWTFVPRAALTTRYDQNARLTPDTDDAQPAADAYAAAVLALIGDTTKLSLEPQLDIVRYPREHTLDRDVLQVNALGAKFFETSEWDLQTNYVRDTTVLSERGTSGLTESNQPHEHISIALSPSFRLTEKWSASANSAWSNDSYPRARDELLVDYDYSSLGGQASYAATERTSLAMDASFSELQTPSLRTTTRQYAANVRLETALNDRWNLSLAAGPLRVVSDFVTDNGVGYTAKLSKRGEISSIEVIAQHDVVPNGRGVLSKRDHATAQFIYTWSARWTSNVSAQWSKSADAVPSFNLEFPAIRYYSAEGSLAWQATPTISASLLIGWNRQDFEGIAGVAKGYRTALSLHWQALDPARAGR